jgi:hypothetical protein
VATHPGQDPHHIEARPALIARLRSADFAVCTGASLEAGGLPTLQERASSARARDVFSAADHVRLIDPQPGAIGTPWAGDVHAEGNPHLHADPRDLLEVEGALARSAGPGAARRTRGDRAAPRRLRGALALAHRRVGAPCRAAARPVGGRRAQDPRLPVAVARHEAGRRPRAPARDGAHPRASATAAAGLARGTPAGGGDRRLPGPASRPLAHRAAGRQGAARRAAGHRARGRGREGSRAVAGRPAARAASGVAAATAARTLVHHH